jgi:uncharacterized membrane protein YedE/YeeE
MKGLVALVVGFLFALGLGMSGMTNPQIVKGFLDIFGEWDWRLAGVMIGAIGVHAVTFHFIMKRKTPVFDLEFHVPKSKVIDKELIIGAVLFGIGWGWAGICPGPAIVNLATGNKHIILFVTAMLLGMKLYQQLTSLAKSPRT